MIRHHQLRRPPIPSQGISVSHFSEPRQAGASTENTERTLMPFLVYRTTKLSTGAAPSWERLDPSSSRSGEISGTNSENVGSQFVSLQRAYPVAVDCYSEPSISYSYLHGGLNPLHRSGPHAKPPS